MHQVIKDNLEAYLGTARGRELPGEFSLHLESCDGCRREVGEMRAQSRLFATMRPEAEVDPPAGFYGRVMDIIEAQKRASIWVVFSESPFGRKIAFASLLLAILMGAYMVSTEPGGELALRDPAPAVQVTPVLGPNQQQDRDAVLVNLATYQEQ